MVVTPVGSAIFGGFSLWLGEAAGATILFAVGGLAALVTAAFTVPCRYTILTDTLSIRCGLIVYQVALSEIENIEKSSSLHSGPALSIKRVLVSTNKRGYLISPKDCDGFIRELRKAAKQSKSR